MNIFQTLFGGQQPAGGAAQQAPVQQQAPTPGNIPPNAAQALASTATPQTAPNGVVPGTTDITSPVAKSGLDQFAELFNTVPPKDGEGPQPLFNVSIEKIRENAAKQNFAANMTPERIQKMAAGGAEGVAEMMAVINEVAQNAYAHSTLTATRLIEGGLEKGGYAKLDDVKSNIRQSAVDVTLRDSNPIFSHPATAPILETMKSNLLQKFPNASPTEIAAMANQYLTEFIGAAQAPQVAAQAATKAKATAGEDWSNFLNG